MGDRDIGWLRRIPTTPVHTSQLLGAQWSSTSSSLPSQSSSFWLAQRWCSMRHRPFTFRLHSLRRTRHRRDLLARLGTRRPGSYARHGQRCVWRALLRLKFLSGVDTARGSQWRRVESLTAGVVDRSEHRVDDSSNEIDLVDHTSGLSAPTLMNVPLFNESRLLAPVSILAEVRKVYSLGSTSPPRTRRSRTSGGPWRTPCDWT